MNPPVRLSPRSPLDEVNREPAASGGVVLSLTGCCTGTLGKVFSAPPQCIRPKQFFPPHERNSEIALVLSHPHRPNSIPLPSGPGLVLIDRPEGFGHGGVGRGTGKRVHWVAPCSHSPFSSYCARSPAKDFIIHDQGPFVEKIKSELTARRWGEGSSTVGWSFCGSVSVTV